MRGKRGERRRVRVKDKWRIEKKNKEGDARESIRKRRQEGKQNEGK